jgi:hypothetical protein
MAMSTLVDTSMNTITDTEIGHPGFPLPARGDD